MNILKILLHPLSISQKSFWTAVGGALAGALGSGLGSGLMGNLFGQSEGSQQRDRRKDQHYTLEQIKLGNEMDLQNQKDMFDFRMGRARGAGLTNVEMYGSGIAGAGGGTTGSGSTLGNAASSRAIADRQIEKDRQLAWQSKIADNATALQQTKMQTDTQKEVAGMQTGATERGQDIQKAIAEGRLNLDRDSLELNKKVAAANIGKTEQETEKLINEVATSDKDFVVYMKQLSMGADNMLVEYFQRHHGINLSDPKSFTSLPKEKREALLTAMIALSSSSYKETQGARSALTGQAEGLGNSLERIFTNPVGLHEGIELTPGAERALGNQKGPVRGRRR